MKEKILKLRQEGKSYKEICDILGCSKGVVSYHCGYGQKEKQLARQRRLRSKLVMLHKVENFQYNGIVKYRTDSFQRKERHGKKRSKCHVTFSWRDVIEKFGWETTCYITGRRINLREPKTYQFDHMVPASKGGSDTIDNLGICCRNANQAKHDMLFDDFLQLCKEVLEYNGYEVKGEASFKS